MASRKRKRSFGSTKADHLSTAKWVAGSTKAIRSQFSQEMAHDNCWGAIGPLLDFARAQATMVAHARSAREGGHKRLPKKLKGAHHNTIAKLMRKFMHKCVRKPSEM